MTRALWVATALSLALPPGGAIAQRASGEGGGRVPRRVIFSLVGAAAGAAAATTYALLEGESLGNCSRPRCVSVVSVAAGTLLGYMIGRESDRLYALRYRHGRPLSLGGQRVALGVIPNDVRVRGPTVAVAGEGGVEILSGELERLGTRGRGLRGVQLADPEPSRNRLLIGTSAGLYAFPLVGEQTLGQLLAPGEVSALALGADRAIVASGREAIVAVVREDSLVPLAPPRAFASAVVDIAWDAGRARAWVLTESALVALAVSDSGFPDSLGALPLAAAARRIDLDGDTLAVATGEGGILLVDVTDPRAPGAVAQWTGARFAYDVALRRGVVYLAAGPEGLYVLEADGQGGLRAGGLDRNLGFVSALWASDDALYAVDRTGRALHRIPLRAP